MVIITIIMQLDQFWLRLLFTSVNFFGGPQTCSRPSPLFRQERFTLNDWARDTDSVTVCRKSVIFGNDSNSTPRRIHGCVKGLKDPQAPLRATCWGTLYYFRTRVMGVRWTASRPSIDRWVVRKRSIAFELRHAFIYLNQFFESNLALFDLL